MKLAREISLYNEWASYTMVCFFTPYQHTLYQSPLYGVISRARMRYRHLLHYVMHRHAVRIECICICGNRIHLFNVNFTGGKNLGKNICVVMF